jgi:hypothetical protein
LRVTINQLILPVTLGTSKIEFLHKVEESQATSLNSVSIFCLDVLVVEVLKDEILLMRVGGEEVLYHVRLVNEFEPVVDDFQLIADSIISGVDLQVVAEHTVVLDCF